MTCRGAWRPASTVLLSHAPRPALDDPPGRRCPAAGAALAAVVDMVTGDPAIADLPRGAVGTIVSIGFWMGADSSGAADRARLADLYGERCRGIYRWRRLLHYEFEINALSTIYEVFFIWQDAYTRGSRFDVPEFDLLEYGGALFVRRQLLIAAARHSGGARTRARPAGRFSGWDLPGLRFRRTLMDGTINSRRTIGKGWRVELGVTHRLAY